MCFKTKEKLNRLVLNWPRGLRCVGAFKEEKDHTTHAPPGPFRDTRQQ